MPEAELIFYVADQSKSRDFYSLVFQIQPELDVPGMTSFVIGPGVKLGLMPENGIAKIITPAVPHPSIGSGIPRCELYLIVTEPQSYLDRALAAGATPISAVAARDWNAAVGYCADPDGHILAFAQPM